jgi:hypothetical protein
MWTENDLVSQIRSAYEEALQKARGRQPADELHQLGRTAAYDCARRLGMHPSLTESAVAECSRQLRYTA